MSAQLSAQHTPHNFTPYGAETTGPTDRTGTTAKDADFGSDFRHSRTALIEHHMRCPAHGNLPCTGSTGFLYISATHGPSSARTTWQLLLVAHARAHAGTQALVVVAVVGGACSSSSQGGLGLDVDSENCFWAVCFTYVRSSQPERLLEVALQRYAANTRIFRIHVAAAGQLPGIRKSRLLHADVITASGSDEFTCKRRPYSGSLTLDVSLRLQHN